MRTATNELTPSADFTWEKSRHGIGGYATMIVPSRNSSGDKKAIIGRDTSGLSIKNVTTEAWTDIIRPDNTPAGTCPANDERPSVFAADWAGNSGTQLYAVLASKVMFYNGSAWSDCAAISGFLTAPGKGEYRVVHKKCASDLTNANFFAFCCASKGWYYSVTQGAAWTKATWIPDPTHPLPGNIDENSVGGRMGQIARDDTSARVGSGGADRQARWAVSSLGNGIYLSTDGMATGSKISPTSAHVLDYPCDLLWVGGVLYAITGNATAPVSGEVNNLWKWSGSGTSWTQLTNSPGRSFVGMVEDPRTPGALFLSMSSSNYCYVSNPNTPNAYQEFNGNPGAASLGQVKVRKRPYIANLYREDFGYYATGPMAIVGPYLYYLLGYGCLRTPYATFPTTGTAGATNYSSAYPDWEEDCDGYEAIVGQLALFTGKTLFCGGQDVGMTPFHDTGFGHDATYTEFPGTGLTNAIGGARGSTDPNFAAFAMLKSGRQFGYCTDGKKLKLFPNQPVNSDLSGYGPSCGVAVGPDASSMVVAFPGYGGVPQFTPDLGATAWSNLTFYKDAASGGGALNLAVQFNGFHGAPYYANHWPVCYDPITACFYALNMGAKDGAGWESDPLGYGGIYKMNPATEPGVFRRVVVGNPITYGNLGLYTLYLMPTGTGKLIIMPNPLAGAGPGNSTLEMNLATYATRPLTVENLSAIAVGPALYSGGPRGTWAAGYYGGTYGLWLSFDYFATAPWGPSGAPKNFNFKNPLGGNIKHLDAHPTRFGLLAAALDAGHMRGVLAA